MYIWTWNNNSFVFFSKLKYGIFCEEHLCKYTAMYRSRLMYRIRNCTKVFWECYILSCTTISYFVISRSFFVRFSVLITFLESLGCKLFKTVLKNKICQKIKKLSSFVWLMIRMTGLTVMTGKTALTGMTGVNK